MPDVANISIHPSQFPDAVRRDLRDSLCTRQVNHKFHYDSVKQTQKWLALHQAHSPSRHDADCAATYDRAFSETAARLPASRVQLLGIGCGGGQKDARLLKLLSAAGREVGYTPCDVSVAMVLVARASALEVVPAHDCFPFVCDLATAAGLADAFTAHAPPDATRLLTFFGMIPNFEPAQILPRLAELVRPGDWLLFSANLAPGTDYAAGVRRILPQYDNPLTRDWLLTFLLDLGVERDDGEMRFSIEEGGPQLQRVAAHFHFTRPRTITLDGERFPFHTGGSMRLFFSYRYTPLLVKESLQAHGLLVEQAWITVSAEEGVFLVKRSAA